MTNSYYSKQSTDELKQKLHCTTFELESARLEAKEEMRKNKENMKQLVQLLKIAYQERDEARDQLQKLLNKVMPSSPTEICTIIPQLQPNSHPEKPTKANSSITESSDSVSETYNHHSYGSSPVDSFFDAISSPDLSHMNLAYPYNMVVPHQPFVQEYNGSIPMGMNSSGHGSTSQGVISSGATKIDQTSAIIDKLAKAKPLPQKGRLLQAVMEAGPLLQTLLVAGPLPRWRNPPALQPFQIPPVSLRGCDSEVTNQNPVTNPNYTVKSSLNSSYLEIPSGSSQIYCTSMLNFTSGSSSCPNNGLVLPACINRELKRQKFQ
ncbi:hypothetical protein HHK36_010933 [Tetracentron sinense]|uniref:Uncharacterized protein n=1 Tax=Tetracentron sinense TaxID=13715 RepID=A0A835DJF8_TETSI|nr:hypothetical protein HHK36_010933 [Tetracentron sinense]